MEEKGYIKRLKYMLENNYNEDKIAWHIFLNGRTNWYTCKKMAKEMRESYEDERKENRTNE